MSGTGDSGFYSDLEGSYSAPRRYSGSRNPSGYQPGDYLYGRDRRSNPRYGLPRSSELALRSYRDNNRSESSPLTSAYKPETYAPKSTDGKYERKSSLTNTYQPGGREGNYSDSSTPVYKHERHYSNSSHSDVPDYNRSASSYLRNKEHMPSSYRFKRRSSLGGYEDESVFLPETRNHAKSRNRPLSFGAFDNFPDVSTSRYDNDHEKDDRHSKDKFDDLYQDFFKKVGDWFSDKKKSLFDEDWSMFDTRDSMDAGPAEASKKTAAGKKQYSRRSSRSHSAEPEGDEDYPDLRRKAFYNQRLFQRKSNTAENGDSTSQGSRPRYRSQSSYTEKVFCDTQRDDDNSDASDKDAGYSRRKPGIFTHRAFSESREETMGADGKTHCRRHSRQSEWRDDDPKSFRTRGFGDNHYGNLFDNFDFKFGSFGTFSKDKPGGKRTEFFFDDFDDFVSNFQDYAGMNGRYSHFKDSEERRSASPAEKENPDCQYTCHTKCRPLVMLDCKSISPENRSGPPKSTSMLFDDPPSPPTRSSKDDADSGYNSGRLSSTQPPPGERTLTREDLRKQIDAFNTNQHGLLMTLHENDVTFQGFIRVHMNLIRPISMSISTRPPSIYEVLTHEDQDTLNDDTGTQTTSFYLPKDTTKVIHIKSETTTQELIRALLQKFKITDNPRKFALYEKAVKDGKMRKLGDAERPLPLCLTWTAEGLNQHRFVLQENDTMEIQWEAFSLPELENFLRILDREEAEYVDQVKAKYGLMKIHVQQRLKDMGLVHSDQRQPVFV